jgi:hypothetical protein
MIPYLAILFLATISAYWAGKYSSESVNKITVFLISILLVVYAGLRDRSVGLDTGGYVNNFKLFKSDPDITMTTEVGYNMLVSLVATFSSNYAVLLSAIAAIVVTLYLVGIYKVVHNYYIGFFSFIAFGYYTFFFNGARQGIACAICFFSLVFLLKRKALPYYFLVALAALFHHSAIIAAPLYFLAQPKIGTKQWLWFLFLIVASVFSLKFFVSLAASLVDDRYASYSQEGAGGGEVLTLFLVCQGLILYWLRRVAVDSDKYSRLINIYILGLAPAIATIALSVNPSGILRLTQYFSHVSIIMWPLIFSGLRLKSNKIPVGLMFFLVGVLYFSLATSRFSDLVPYSLNSEIFGE